MAEYQGLNFVGIVEHIIQGETPSYNYCKLDILSGGIADMDSIEMLGGRIVSAFGKNFREKITYEPPQGIDKGGLCPKRYHRLSVLEQNKFEKVVLDVLKGLENSGEK